MLKIFNSKVTQNATWIIFCRIIQAVLALVISMLTARYLGPSDFGLINYASSIVNFVIPIVFLGFNNTLVHELTTHPEKESQIMGTSICLSVISSLCCILGVFGFVSFVNTGEQDTIIVCMLYSAILFFQVLDLIQYWFQAKLLSKYSSIASLIAYAIVSIYKVFLLVTNKSVYWFAVSNAIDYALISLFLLLIYFKLGGKRFSFSKSLAKEMFCRSKHYIVSGLMVAIFAQTDKIMLKLMINEIATGLYSAAVSCAGITAFVFSAIVDSFRPVVFKSYTESKEKYEQNIIKLYSVIIYISLAQSLFMTIFADPIISLLYGQDYSQSANALRIITWYTTFSYLGVVRGIWILNKNYQKYLWIINLSGALLNVIINFLLIPFIGIYGAAIASLLTQFFANFIIGFIIKPIRENNVLMIKGFNPKWIISLLKAK